MHRVLSCLLLWAATTAATLHAASESKPPEPSAKKKKAAATSSAKKKKPATAAPKKKTEPAPKPPTAAPTSRPEPATKGSLPPGDAMPAAAPSSPAVDQPALPERKLETLLLMPEPRVMRTALSITPAGAQHTVLTPYRESTTVSAGVEPHTPASLQKLGLSVETFAQRARAVADKRLLQMQPELIKGEDGRVAYAVYRGESSLFATLLMAPSLPKVFEPLFGKEIWVAMPDRHALYVFPPNADLLASFTSDLAERYATDPYAASAEVFSLKDGQEPEVIAGFAAAQE